MLFSKKKKLQRDRDAGLVFRWRGGYGTNRGGSTIAFLLTAMVFTAGFVMLNVYAKSSTVPSRYSAELIQLGEMDEDLAWWVERNSPDLPAWSGNGDEQSDDRVNALLTDAIHEAHNKSYRYEEMELKQIEIDNEVVYALSMRSLPSLRRLKAVGSAPRVGGAEEVDWKLSVIADGELKGRLPEALEYSEWMPERWRGLSARFIIAVDAGGEVISVDSVGWTEDEVVKGLENWVYSISFKPVVSEGAQTVTGVLDLRCLPVIKPMEKGDEL